MNGIALSDCEAAAEHLRTAYPFLTLAEARAHVGAGIYEDGGHINIDALSARNYSTPRTIK